MAPHRNPIRQARRQLPRLHQAGRNHALAQIIKLSPQPRAVGSEAARGDLILFLDSDDLLVAEGVERLVEAALQHPAASLFYGNLKIGAECTDFLRLRGNVFKTLLKNMSLCPFSGLLVRKTALPWDRCTKDIRAWQDDDFNLCVAKTHEVHFVDTLTAEYRLSPDSISKGYEKKIAGLQVMLKKWAPDMRRVVGLRCVIAWRLMLYALETESKMVEAMAENKPKLRPGYISLKLSAKAARMVSTSYLDRLYV